MLLKILWDARVPRCGLLRKIDAVLEGIAPLSLQARDQVSVYALDCTLIKTLDDVPAEQERLRRAVGFALGWWTDCRQEKYRSEWNTNFHLSEALAFFLGGLHCLSGPRRMLG